MGLVKKALTVLATFILIVALSATFILWTEYAYQRGVTHAMYEECEASSSDRQIN